jgi:hypothetical protein
MNQYPYLSTPGYNRIRAEVYDPVQRIYERRLAEENRRIENLQINQAFINNLVAIENARHRRQN